MWSGLLDSLTESPYSYSWIGPRPDLFVGLAAHLTAKKECVVRPDPPKKPSFGTAFLLDYRKGRPG